MNTQLQRRVLDLLHKLNPHKYIDELEGVVALLVTICPKLNEAHLLEWLKTSNMDVSVCRRLLKQAFTRLKGPFSFDLIAGVGWVLIHYKDSDVEGCEDIVRVPCVYLDSNGKELNDGGEIRADVRVGDEVCLRRYPDVWWIVHEVRPHTNSILLIRADSSRRKSKLKGREYKEIYALSLVGCLVKRFVLPYCPEHYPGVCQCIQAEGDKRWCTFQLPKPDAQAALAHLRSLVEEGDEGYNMGDILGGVATDDHLVKMQRSAHVQAWMEKKRILIKASNCLKLIHSTLSLSRYHWLSVGRALRVVSLGGRDLFHVWWEWARSCEAFATSEADCLAAWTSLRPSSNCDEAGIVRARQFLCQRREELYHIDHPEALSDSVPRDDIYFDPLCRQIIDEAEERLRYAYLSYWVQSTDSVECERSRSSRKNIGKGFSNVRDRERTLTVPCAQYTYEPSLHADPTAVGVDSSHGIQGQFEEMSTCPARIHVSDIICLANNAYDYPHSAQCAKQWYYVLRVDLLFARVLVTRCEAPPGPWRISPDVLTKQTCHWISVSKLWRVLVCSRVGMTEVSPSLTGGPLRYLMFVTPLPDPKGAVEFLKSLSTQQPSDILGKHAASAACPRHSSQISSNSSSRISVNILDTDVNALTICWSSIHDVNINAVDYSSSSPQGILYEDLGLVVVSIRQSGNAFISDWVDVYRGKGRGCMITNLQAATKYHIRLKVTTDMYGREQSGDTVYTFAQTTEDIESCAP